MTICLQNWLVSIFSGKLNSSVLNTIYADRNLSTSNSIDSLYVFLNGFDNVAITLGLATGAVSETSLECALDNLLSGNVTERTMRQL